MIVDGKDFVNLLHDHINELGVLDENEREILDKKIQDFIKNKVEGTLDVPETIYNKVMSSRRAESSNLGSIVQTIESCYHQIKQKDQGWSPLHHAAYDGNLPEVKRLLAEGIDIHAKTNRDTTPFGLAYMNGHFEVIKALIEAGALDEINQKDEEGWANLHYAASKGKTNEIKKLIQAGAKIDEMTSTGSTPLSIALKSGHPEVVKELIAKGANIKKVDLEGSTLFDILDRKRRTDSKCSLLFDELKKSYPKLRAKNKESRNRISLSHAWNLGGFSPLVKIGKKEASSEVKLEGSFSTESFRLMVKHLMRFKKEHSELKDELILNETLTFASLQEAFSSEEIAKRIKEGLPTFVQAGYSGHAITFLFYKDQFIVCNQGMLSTKAMEVYHFDTELLTPSILEQIKEAKIDLSGDRVEKYKNFFKELKSALDLKQTSQDIELEKVTPLPKQIVGNCAWVSPHIALCALMLLMGEDIELFNALHQSEQFYILETSLKRFKKNEQYFKMDHDLFETALHKAYLLPLNESQSVHLQAITDKYLSLLDFTQQAQLKSSLVYWKTHPHEVTKGDHYFYARMKESVHESTQDMMSFFDEIMSDLEKEES